MKMCTMCGETKPIREFHPRAAKCKPCRSAYRRERHRQNPDVKRNQNYKHRYGIGLEDVRQLLIHYPACAICSTPFTDTQHIIDHDHRTGALRGLLCDACNKGLGMFKDDRAILRRAAAYIEEFS